MSRFLAWRYNPHDLMFWRIRACQSACVRLGGKGLGTLLPRGLEYMRTAADFQDLLSHKRFQLGIIVNILLHLDF